MADERDPLARLVSLIVLVVALSAPSVQAPAQTQTCNGLPVTTSGTTEHGLIFGTDGDDVMVGTDDDDRIFAGEGNDTVCGLAGNDDLTGSGGTDYLDGGSGGDHLFGCDQYHLRGDNEVCSEDETGRDDLIGGEGDDHLFGDVAADALDGGPGFDVADGGEHDDVCSAERYARCESIGQPEAPTACGNGSDDDGDGLVDVEDPECNSYEDPTEDTKRDPVCFNGNDDDDDQARDYPEDLGCMSFADSSELNCGLPCHRAISITYNKAKSRYEGAIIEEPDRCAWGRLVAVRKPNGTVVGRTRSDAEGKWRLRIAKGRWLHAYAPRTSYRNRFGDTVRCSELWSRTR
jgi:hypothetical protein